MPLHTCVHAHSLQTHEHTDVSTYLGIYYVDMYTCIINKKNMKLILV